MSYLNEMLEMLRPSTSEPYLLRKLGDYTDINTLKNIAMAAFILMLANGISILLLNAQNVAGLAPADPYLDIILQFIDYALFFYVSSYILYLVAKVLKGKGKFREQIYLQSVVAVALSLIQGLLIVLTSVPATSDPLLIILLSLPLLFAGLYTIYMDYKVVKVAHKLERKTAIFSIIGFWLTIFAVYFIIYAGVYMLTGQGA